MVELRVISRSKLESGEIAATVVPVDKSAVSGNGWAVRDTVTLVLPTNHDMHKKIECRDAVGQDPVSGNLIYQSRWEDKANYEFTEHDMLALVAELSQRVWVLERFCKQMAAPEGVITNQ
jgi:hypothetical protein